MSHDVPYYHPLLYGLICGGWYWGLPLHSLENKVMG